MNDEFMYGIWWVPGKDGLRNATAGECAQEIQNLRAKLREAEQKAELARKAVLEESAAQGNTNAG